MTGTMSGGTRIIQENKENRGKPWQSQRNPQISPIRLTMLRQMRSFPFFWGWGEAPGSEHPCLRRRGNMEAPLLEETSYSENSLCLSILQDRIWTLFIFSGHKVLKVKGKSNFSIPNLLYSLRITCLKFGMYFTFLQ